MTLIILLNGDGSVINSATALSDNALTTEEEGCIAYDRTQRTITIGCGNLHLSDIRNKLQDRNVIDRQTNGVWLLNAGIVIERSSTLTIDSKDTK